MAQPIDDADHKPPHVRAGGVIANASRFSLMATDNIHWSNGTKLLPTSISLRPLPRLSPLRKPLTYSWRTLFLLLLKRQTTDRSQK
jgi:hypothetical protein